MHVGFDLFEHYYGKGLINDHYFEIGQNKAYLGDNPFTDEIQIHMTRNALKNRKTFHTEYINKRYCDMTLLFASEGRDPCWTEHDPETIDNHLFKNLEKAVSIPGYDIRVIRPLIYEIRDELERKQNGEWTLGEVLEQMVPVINNIK